MEGAWGAVRKGLVTLAVSLLFLLLSLQLLLPLAASLALTRAARETAGRLAEVKVEVSAFPAVKIFLGRMDRVAVDMRNIRPGGVPVSRLSAVVYNARFDVRRLLGPMKTTVLFLEPADLTVAFSGEDLSILLGRRAGGLQEPKVVLVPGGAVGSGKISLVGTVVPV
jgi:hypothetical protein